MCRCLVGNLCNGGGIVFITLEEVLDTLRVDVKFQRKGVSCAALQEAIDTLRGDVEFWRKYVSLCIEDGKTCMFFHIV